MKELFGSVYNFQYLYYDLVIKFQFSWQIMSSPITRIRSRPRKAGRHVRTSITTRSPQPKRKNLWQNGNQFQPRPTIFIPPFQIIQQGFNVDLDSSPFHIIRQFVDDDMVDQICHETNQFAVEIKSKFPKSLKRWTPLDEPTFWKFMAISSLMGVVKKGDIKDYWSKDELIATPVFGMHMSRDR